MTSKKEYIQVYKNGYEDCLEDNTKQYISYEAQLKAKDEEIERLKADKECAKDVIDWHEKECKQYVKLHYSKARQIVAMLFWISKRSKRGSFYNHAKIERACFERAYKMLKDEQ